MHVIYNCKFHFFSDCRPSQKVCCGVF
jgi:hypothetical protein